VVFFDENHAETNQKSLKNLKKPLDKREVLWYTN